MAKANSYIGIKNEANSKTLELHFTDYIYDGFDWNTWEVTNLVQDTIDKIKAAAPDTIKIIINSLGGDVMIGLALYNYLKSYKAEKEVEIIGFAASIASIMAMCASPGKLKMAKNSFMIIHAASSGARGNAKDLREQAENLDKVTNELADIYAQRSGKHDAKYFTNLWADGDYWMTGTEAKKLGLVDELFNAEPVTAQLDFAAHNFKHIPAGLITADAGRPADNSNTFFSNLNEHFMKFFDTLKNSISGAKTDKKFENVAGRDDILAMVEEVLKPFAEALDAKVAEEEKPKAEETKPVVEEKPAEKVEEKKEVVAEESEEVKKLKADLKKAQDALAAKTTKPEKDLDDTAAAMLAKYNVEYEN